MQIEPILNVRRKIKQQHQKAGHETSERERKTQNMICNRRKNKQITWGLVVSMVTQQITEYVANLFSCSKQLEI